MIYRDDNQTITNLLLPNRDIPVLLSCKDEKADGRVFSLSRDSNSGRRSFQETCVYEPFRGKRSISTKGIRKDFRERLLNLLALNQAAESKKTGLVHDLRKDGIDRGLYTPEEAADPIRLFASMFNVGLHRSMFIIWMDDKRRKLRPGLLCTNIQTAYFANALSRFGTRSALRLCLNCQHKLHGRQRSWCSNRCKSVVNMARYRKSRKAPTTKPVRRLVG